MGYHKIGVASVESIQDAILEILGSLEREYRKEKGEMEKEQEEGFVSNFNFTDRAPLFVQGTEKDGQAGILIIPFPSQAGFVGILELRCICTCVNCNRSYETKPRTKNERTRKVLCVQCRRSYEGS